MNIQQQIFGGGMKRFVRNVALCLFTGTTLGMSYSAIEGHFNGRSRRIGTASPSIVMRLGTRMIFNRSKEQVAERPIANSYDFVKSLPGERTGMIVRAYEKLMADQGMKYDSKRGWIRTGKKTSEDLLLRDFELALSRAMDDRANNYLERF